MKLTDPKIFVDHINHNGLDNRRCNIRIVDNQKNGFNKRPNNNCLYSQYKGVSYYKKDKKWSSQISVNNKSIYLGRYDTELEASYAYDIACRYIYGPYANPNHKEEHVVNKIYKVYLDYPYKENE